MSSEVVALLAGTVLAVGALAFVLYPLFFDVRPRIRPPAPVQHRPADDSAIVALREIEFDRATGKLSESDYQELKQQYSERALREMRRAGSTNAVVVAADPIEARVRAFRSTHRECVTCGVRPEADAIYCSNCGAFLDRACPECGAEIVEPGAGFCAKCGIPLSQHVSAVG